MRINKSAPRIKPDFCEILLATAHPKKVKHAERRNHIDGAVKLLPPLTAHLANHCVRRCDSQRCEQHKRQHTHRDERAFDDISHDGDKIQPHVEQGVADEVQGHVKIDEQTEHAAQADQRGCLYPIA